MSIGPSPNLSGGLVIAPTVDLFSSEISADPLAPPNCTTNCPGGGGGNGGGGNGGGGNSTCGSGSGPGTGPGTGSGTGPIPGPGYIIVLNPISSVGVALDAFGIDNLAPCCTVVDNVPATVRPPAVPSASNSPFSCTVYITISPYGSTSPPTPNLTYRGQEGSPSGFIDWPMPIYNERTGVTVNLTCSGATFYFPEFMNECEFKLASALPSPFQLKECLNPVLHAFTQQQWVVTIGGMQYYAGLLAT